ncbi:MAG TPA: hypothetical protein VJ697_03735 [Nitrososphaeraceae archaeon]|nr:hypothetical protein [Nitrososphaeraceae archaeon]
MRNLSILLFLTVFLTFSSYHSTDANRPIADVEPECGVLRDHRINMTANGFNENGNVYWEFINSKGFMDPYGYFDTNATGGFDDFTFADGFLPDTYLVRFFDDKNNDYLKDANGFEVNLTYTIPCNK